MSRIATAKKAFPKAHRKTAKRPTTTRRPRPTMTAAEYDALVERLVEDVTDRLAVANAGDPADDLPGALVLRMIDGESPVKIWRLHRGMKQVDLAAASGIKKSRLSQIEHGAAASVEKMAALARALGVSMDDLI